MRGSRLIVAALAWGVIAACATGGAGVPDVEDEQAGGAIGGTLSEDVVRVGGFGRVAALAISRSRVYVAADGGLAMYDRLAQRWLIPVPLRMDADRFAGPALAIADPATDAVWLTAGARLWIVRPTTHFVTSLSLPAPASELLVDRTGRGAYVFANDWWLVSSSGSATPLSRGQGPLRDDVIAATDAQQILRETSGLQSFGRLLTRDEQLRSWPMTTLARAPERSEVWAGTNGGGVFVVDPAFLKSTQMPYGLRARGATALALAADGVWIAEEADAFSQKDLALTFASRDLGTWRWLSPSPGRLGVVSMATRGRFACLATNAGAMMIDLEARQIPAPRLQELSQIGRQTTAWSTPDGCWIGGTHGIARVSWPDDSTGKTELVAEGLGAFSFASSGDTVWVVTLSRVRTFLTGKDAFGDPRGAEDITRTLPNAFGGPIRALALAGKGLALLTDREIWLTGGAFRLTTAQRIDAPLQRLGLVRRLVADERTLWLAGTLGAAAYSLRDNRWRFLPLSDPSGVSGLDAGRATDVRDLALAPGVAWLATGAGIVRVARSDDGMPR